MQEIRDGARLTIATVHLLSEGIDCPGWDTFFLVSPISGGPRTLQAIGGIGRPAPGKARATVSGFVDVHVSFRMAAHQARAKLYRNTAI
jgi:superfamily II DNA or RNA helicase